MNKRLQLMRNIVRIMLNHTNEILPEKNLNHENMGSIINYFFRKIISNQIKVPCMIVHIGEDR